MIYLAIITLGLICGLEWMGIQYRFPIQYEIYISMIIEMLVDIKNKLTPVMIDICYKLLYIFSVCQIQFNKMVKLISPYVKDVKQYLKDKGLMEDIPIQIIELISKNGDVEHKLIISDKTPLEEVTFMFNPDRHTGILLYDKNFELGYINKIYYEKGPFIRDYKLSNINFMMIELVHENEKHPIVLKNDTYNYYIVNNSLNQNFFKYYLKNVLKVPINENKFDYTVFIIDDNVNFITLLPHQHIVFNEHDYTIFPILEVTETNNTTESGETNNTCVPENTHIQSSISINNDEQSSCDSDKSDDFVNLDIENLHSFNT
jgi:hypothetical protein